MWIKLSQKVFSWKIYIFWSNRYKWYTFQQNDLILLYILERSYLTSRIRLSTIGNQGKPLFHHCFDTVTFALFLTIQRLIMLWLLLINSGKPSTGPVPRMPMPLSCSDDQHFEMHKTESAEHTFKTCILITILTNSAELLDSDAWMQYVS